MNPNLTFAPDIASSDLSVAMVWGDLFTTAPNPLLVDSNADWPPELSEFLNEAASKGEAFWPSGQRQLVRKLLRYKKYKPSGRNRPASEFLLQAAIKGTFPKISPIVDINNIISCRSGLPCSIFDWDLTGNKLLIRRGTEDESYIFNPAGHSIRLRDLLLVCNFKAGIDIPCGTPVKDSMATKIRGNTSRFIAIIYGPAQNTDSEGKLNFWARTYAEALKNYCGSTNPQWTLKHPD